MKQTQTYRVLWQKREDMGVRLLRICGMSPLIRIPSQIAGRPVVEIAPYCFARNSRLPKEGYEETLLGQKDSHVFLQELCGNEVEEVWLPDTVKEIGSCAFYNCRNLKTLEIGAGVEEIGGDAFMNTMLFRKLILRHPANGKSKVRKILSQISSDLEVYFRVEGKTEAVLFYPEYYETYDEIAPAHLFGRKITGGGFRARQCFLDECVDFSGYDDVFLQACAEESETTLSRMALDRLQYPYGLTDKKKGIYRLYIKEHMPELANRLVLEKNLEILHFLCREGMLYGVNLAECIQAAAEADWPEGAADLLQMQASGREKEREKRYDFDAF